MNEIGNGKMVKGCLKVSIRFKTDILKKCLSGTIPMSKYILGHNHFDITKFSCMLYDKICAKCRPKLFTGKSILIHISDGPEIKIFTCTVVRKYCLQAQNTIYHSFQCLLAYRS